MKASSYVMQGYPDAPGRGVVAVTLILASLIVGSVQAQQAEEQAPGVESSQDTSDMEEVIVTGERTRRALIREAGRETENFYMRLNEVLDDDDFRISCRTEYPTGSNIATKVCRTRFQERLESRQALSDLQNIQSTDEGILVYEGVRYEIQPEMLIMQQAFGDAMLQAVNADQELNAMFWRLVDLKAAVDGYETPREQRRRERDEFEGTATGTEN